MTYTGIVAGGSKRAALMGYPTANILLSAIGVSGSYIARVSSDGLEYPAVAYADQARKILEAHLFNFSGDLYGKEITVTLLKKIRDGEQFETEEALHRAVQSDITAARAYFNI